MAFFRKVLILFGFSLAIWATPASACGECEYKEKFTGLCVPKGGCIAKALNPVEQAKKLITVAQAVASGDAKQTKIALGDALMNSPNCLGCSAVRSNVLPGLTDEQAKEAVGRGFLVFLATGDPVFVAIDAASNVSKELSLNQSKPPVSLPPTPPARPVKTYAGTAECMSKAKDGSIFAGWKSAPALKDETGVDHVFPDVDLIAGDVLHVTSKLCPSWGDPNTGSVAIDTAKFTYDRSASAPGTGETIKWFLIGK